MQQKLGKTTVTIGGVSFEAVSVTISRPRYYWRGLDGVWREVSREGYERMCLYDCLLDGMALAEVE